MNIHPTNINIKVDVYWRSVGIMLTNKGAKITANYSNQIIPFYR